MVRSILRFPFTYPAWLILPLLPRVILHWLVVLKMRVAFVALRLLPFAQAMWTMTVAWLCFPIATIPPVRLFRDIYRLLLEVLV